MPTLANAQSVGDYRTEAHHLRFEMGPKVNFFNTYSLSVRYKSRHTDTREPDIIFRGGKTDEGLAGDGMCSREVYTFPFPSKAVLEIFHPDPECQTKEHPQDAVGELIVREGAAKGQWWVYRE